MNDLLITFSDYNVLSFLRLEDENSTVSVYVGGVYEDDTLIYWDTEEKEREYIVINNEVVYLDTITEL